MDEVNDTGDVVDRDDAVEPGEAVDTVPNPREPAWPAFLETLKASLAMRTTTAGRCGFMCSSIRAAIRNWTYSSRRCAACAMRRSGSIPADAYTDIAPYLIAFERDALDDEHGGQHRLLRKLWLDAVDLHAVTWLWSTWTFDALDAHLRRYVQYKLPNGRSYYLFFFDNHVFERLRQVWSDAQTRQFVAPFTEIRYRDRRLDEVVAQRCAGDRRRGAGDAPGLSEQQHARLIGSGIRTSSC